MSVVVIGLNHRTVPLDVLEHLTVPDERLPKVLTDLRSRSYVGEAVVLADTWDELPRISDAIVGDLVHGVAAHPVEVGDASLVFGRIDQAPETAAVTPMGTTDSSSRNDAAERCVSVRRKFRRCSPCSVKRSDAIS